MDRHEGEVLLNVACGLDPLTSVIAATGDGDEPPRRKGCLGALLVVFVVTVLASVAWL
jgi:hypothetical protein